MTYPPNPTVIIPTSGQAKAARDHEQGTVQLRLLCVQAAITPLIDAFKSPHSHASYLKKVQYWLNRCWKTAGVGNPEKLSRRTMRRADPETAVVDRVKGEVLGDTWDVDVWAAWLVFLDAITHDTHATWPAGDVQCWQSLSNNLDELTDQFLKACGDRSKAEKMGFEVYLRAMEGTRWT